MPQTTFLKFIKAEEEEGGVFEPEDIAVMTTACDQLLADLKLTNRDDPMVTMVAKLVIQIVRSGERDPDQVRKFAAAKYRL